ncbi:MAG: hypothetical protein HY694_11160 [Deltaproteobacteria bacterium]|nr:hypothetical protein [Deltaproteobacteria bacterium]
MAVNVYAKLKEVLLDFFNPHFEALREEISAIKGELSSPRWETKTVDDKIAAVRTELKGDIVHIDEKLSFANKCLDEALEIRERLAALEARVGR